MTYVHVRLDMNYDQLFKEIPPLKGLPLSTPTQISLGERKHLHLTLVMFVNEGN